MNKEFIFSCPLFGGYRTTLTVVPGVEDLEGLVQRCKEDLRRQLTHLRLEALVATLQERTYHIHSHTLLSLFTTAGPVYVCTCRSQTSKEKAARP